MKIPSPDRKVGGIYLKVFMKRFTLKCSMEIWFDFGEIMDYFCIEKNIFRKITKTVE